MCAALIKKCGAIGVPRKTPHVPSYCQPLFTRLPPGAVVFAVGSPVSSKMTPRALPSAIRKASAANFFTGSIE